MIGAEEQVSRTGSALMTLQAALGEASGWLRRHSLSPGPWSIVRGPCQSAHSAMS